MRKETINRFLLMLVMSLLLMLVVSSVQAATYTNYYEDFEDEDIGGNPTSDSGDIDYAYTESGWDANVTNYLDGYDRFYVNASDSGTDGYSNFTFNDSDSYYYFEFSFNYLNDTDNKHNHSAIQITMGGDIGAIAYLKVLGANTNKNEADRLLVEDYDSTVYANYSLIKDNWYRVRITPDYDTWDDTVRVQVWNLSNSTEIIDVTMDLNSNTQMSSFYMDDISSGKVSIMMDNFTLIKATYSLGETTTNLLSQYVFPILFAIAMLVVIMTMLLSGSITPESLIGVLIIAIVGFIALMIITSL